MLAFCEFFDGSWRENKARGCSSRFRLMERSRMTVVVECVESDDNDKLSQHE